MLMQGTPVFNAPTLSAKGLLQFAQGVLVLRKAYRSMLSPPMFDSPRAIRCVRTAAVTSQLQLQPNHLAVILMHVMSMLCCISERSSAHAVVAQCIMHMAQHCLPVRARAEHMP
jgi:hypothetical protein